ncbi:MAG: hypothetical protein KF729_35965, partial [Sandaracinaceae bacterium]|nr:hypothetical protein [Sandaracinaceae bacterium]
EEGRSIDADAEPAVDAPEPAPGAGSSGAVAGPARVTRARDPSASDDGSPAEERARRAAIRARAHLRQGRYEAALRSARFAARLAPAVESHAALVAEIEAAGGEASAADPGE